MTARRAAILLAALVAVVGFLLFTAPGRGYWVIDPDAAAYVGLARSLVAGDGYSLQGIPHAKFPPGFPLLLSLAISWTGDRECYAAMRDLTTLMGLVDVVLAYAVARRILKLAPGGALFLAFGTAVSIYTLQYTVAYLRSETTFTAFLLAALVCGERWRERGGLGRAALTGLLAAGSIATRSAGIAAVAALALARLLRPAEAGAATLRRDLGRAALLEVALFGLVSIAPAIAHKAYVSVKSHALGIESSDYGDELLAAYPLDLTKDVDEAKPKISPFSSAMAERVEGNLAALGLSLGKFALNDNKGANLATRSSTGKLHPGGFALLALLAIGFCVAVRRRLVVAAALTALYVGLYLIWPFNQQQRFYQPIAPILLGLLAFGAAPLLALAGRLTAKPLGRAAIAVGLLALVVLLALRGRSDAAVVGGRYSYSYIALMAAPLLAGIAFLALAVVPRLRRVDLVRAGARLSLVAALLLGILWAASFRYALRDLGSKQHEFERSRIEHPVASRFSRIKVDPELIALLDRLVAEAKPGEVVMTDIPKMIHEMTGLRTTPLRIDSRKRELVLITPFGRPRYLYFSLEIPQVAEVFDEVIAKKPPWLAPIHETKITEGAITTTYTLYRVAEAD